MIEIVLLLAAPLLAALWLAGLPGLWKGRPKLALGAAGAGIAIGAVCGFGAMIAPRWENIWTGNAGAGDGFGLIGLFLLGGALAGASFILFVITAFVAVSRTDTTAKEVSE